MKDIRFCFVECAGGDEWLLGRKAKDYLLREFADFECEQVEDEGAIDFSRGRVAVLPTDMPLVTREDIERGLEYVRQHHIGVLALGGAESGAKIVSDLEGRKGYSFSSPHFVKIDSAKNAHVVYNQMKDRVIQRLLNAGVIIPDSVSTAIDDTAEVFSGAKILPFCTVQGASVVESGAVLERSRVADSRICSGAVVELSRVSQSEVREGATVENSTLICSRAGVRAHIEDSRIAHSTLDDYAGALNSRIAASTLDEAASAEDSNIADSRIASRADITCARLRGCTVHARACVESSVATDSEIGEGATVGPFARLRGAVIGEECRVGDFVEVKRSTLSRGAKSAHLAYIGDAVVGERTNIGCGVVFCNYDGERKHESKVGDDCFIGANVNLVAPVSVGDGAYIAAGTTITRDVKDGEFAIGRTRQQTKPRIQRDKQD